jgi:diaminopimelate decarboxylase
MDYFLEHQGQLFAEEIPCKVLAERFGTPLYVYSRATLERHYLAFDQALDPQPHEICYAVKANSNIAVLNVLARLGAGFDIVSQGELERVLLAGGKPEKIVFSGVGKLTAEIERALAVGIGCFNVESPAELERLQTIASQMGKIAPIAIRVNPDIDARTHPYISTGLKENKFGIEAALALTLYQQARLFPNIQIKGLGCHIGSQLLDLQPFLAACDRIYQLYLALQEQGIPIEHLDLGGGLGICYRTETPPTPAEYGAALLQRIPNKQLKIIVEPGRAIAANAGVLLTRVEYLKHTPHKNFAIVDAAMNDLIRPALYQAEQEILPVCSDQTMASSYYDVVGPVCETGDFLGKNRQLAIQQGDLVMIRSAGAYGFTMSSNYNSRPRAAEIMVDGDQAYVIRERESLASLYAGERCLP